MEDEWRTAAHCCLRTAESSTTLQRHCYSPCGLGQRQRQWCELRLHSGHRSVGYVLGYITRGGVCVQKKGVQDA